LQACSRTHDAVSQWTAAPPSDAHRPRHTPPVVPVLVRIRDPDPQPCSQHVTNRGGMDAPMPARSTAVSDAMVWGCAASQPLQGYSLGLSAVGVVDSSATPARGVHADPRSPTPYTNPGPPRCPRRAAWALPATWGSTAWRPTARPATRGRRAACTQSFRRPHRTVRSASPSPLAPSRPTHRSGGVAPATTPPHRRTLTTHPQLHSHSLPARRRAPSAPSHVRSAAPSPRRGLSRADGAQRRCDINSPTRAHLWTRTVQRRAPYQRHPAASPNPDPSPLLLR